MNLPVPRCKASTIMLKSLIGLCLLDTNASIDSMLNYDLCYSIYTNCKYIIFCLLNSVVCWSCNDGENGIVHGLYYWLNNVILHNLVILFGLSQACMTWQIFHTAPFFKYLLVQFSLGIDHLQYFYLLSSISWYIASRFERLDECGRIMFTPNSIQPFLWCFYPFCDNLLG